jgi:pimeloyl-ACP methyl ester carboxylesterase
MRRGSKQNFRSLAKTFAQKLGMPVYTLVRPRLSRAVVSADSQDLRNHGASPHVEPHSYEAMATDIAAFFEKHNLKSGVNLLGHSM